MWLQETIVEASQIVQSLKLRLIPNTYHLVCNKGTRLDFYSLTSAGSKQARGESLYIKKCSHLLNSSLHPRLCPIISIAILSPNHLPVDLLCILSSDYRLSLLSYNPSIRSLQILWTCKVLPSWERYQPHIKPKLQIHSNNEFIVILPTATNTITLVKLGLDSLYFDEKRGVSIKRKELQHLLWNFDIPDGRIMDIVFQGNPVLSTRYTKMNIKSFSDRSTSQPNSPYGNAITPPSPKTTSPFPLTYSPGSPSYQSAPTSPYQASPNDKYDNNLSLHEEYIVVAVLVEFIENSQQHLKKLRLYLHSNSLKEDISSSVMPLFPPGNIILDLPNSGLFCFSDKDVHLFQKNKRQVFPLELSSAPYFCTRLSEESYIVSDYSGKIIIIQPIFEKDKITVNKLSKKCITNSNPKLKEVSIFPIESMKRSGSKYASHIVFLCSKTGYSGIAIINTEDLLENRLVFIKKFPSIGPILNCQVREMDNGSIKDVILSSNKGKLYLLEKRVQLHEFANYQQSDIQFIWPLANVSSKGNINYHEFICFSIGNHSTHVVSVQENLSKTSFLKGFDENENSLFIGSLSEPIVIQVTSRQVNVVNRYTGTLLSEWRGHNQSQSLTMAINVSGYLCVLQNQGTIYLLSCETPSVGLTNNRLRKINLELEQTKILSDQICCWDSFSIPETSFFELSNNLSVEKTKIDINNNESDLLDNNDSMVDIWDDICMGESMGRSIPDLDDSSNISDNSNIKIQGLIALYLNQSNSISILSIPTLESVATYSILNKNSKACSIVIFSRNNDSIENLVVIIGFTDSSLISINLIVTQTSIYFQNESETRTSFALSNSPIPCKLFKLPNNLHNDNSDTIKTNILFSGDTNQILEFSNDKNIKFTNSRISFDEPIISLSMFREEQCGFNHPFFILSTESSLKIATILWKKEEIIENNSHSLTSSNLRITSPLSKQKKYLCSCYCKNSVIIIVELETGGYSLEAYDNIFFSLKNTIKLPDNSNFINIYNHSVQDENLIIIVGIYNGKEVLFVYSIDNTFIFSERCIIPCENYPKIISAFGLLLCCTSTHIRGYSWNTNSSQMTKIMEFLYSNESLSKLHKLCTSFKLQRVANFMKDGEVQGTQFHLLISNYLEYTRIINFSIGKGETNVKLIGEFILPQRIIFSSDFISQSGKEIVISDHTGTLFFIHSKNQSNDTNNLELKLQYSYYTGEPISMVKYLPSIQKLYFGSIFGTLFSFTSISDKDNFSKLKELSEALNLHSLQIGSTIEGIYQEEKHHIIQNINQVRDNIPYWSKSGSYGVSCDSNIINGDLLNIFTSFLTDTEKSQVSSSLQSTNFEQIQEILQKYLPK